MAGNLLIVHGGGPTAVINASLCGVIREARKYSEINEIYGASGGMSGLMQEKWISLGNLPEEELERMARTPGSAIGTSRDPIETKDYEKIPAILQKYSIRYVLMNGGNGTMDTCGRMCRALENTDIRVIGIPKTMDNDLAMTDHAPGFGSAARYMAQSVAEVTADVRSLPIHVVIVEACGRNAGWVTAASALARHTGVDGPDLIYLPERPFDPQAYLRDVKKQIEKKKGVVVVASEGLTDINGQPIVDPIFRMGRATYFGDISAHLAHLVIQELGYKARSEKPGLLSRASISLSSSVDRKEAAWAGAKAVRAALEGKTGKMVGFVRESTTPYRIHMELFDVKDVMMTERKLPNEFINKDGNGITQAFVDWCTPLIGQPLDKLTQLER